jgi:flagellar biogenesis protein FliO
MSTDALPLTAGALAAVVALILLLRRVATRLPGVFGGMVAAGGGDPLALEQVLPLGPRRRLMVVRVGRRRLVLLTGPAQDCVCGWLDGDAP